MIPIKAAPRDVRRVEAQVVAVPPELPRRGSSKSGGSNGAQGTVNDFKEAPEWVKILVIFLTSAVVAFFEFAICKSTFRMLGSNCMDLHTFLLTPPGYL